MNRMTARSSVLLLVLAYVGFISLGLPDAVAGVAWPSVRQTFGGLPQAGLGALVACAGAGYVVSSLMAARVIHALGVGGLLAASTALVALAQTGFAAAPLWGVFVACAFVAGLGSGSIDTGLNGYAARHFSLRHMNWLHACYSLGAAGGPLIMTAVLTRGHVWRWGYAVLALIMAALTLAFMLTRRLWDDPAPPSTGEPDAPAPPGSGGPSHGTGIAAGEAPEPLLQVLRHPVVVLQAALFFFLTGLEVAAGQWCFTVFTEWRGETTAAAGTWTGLYWGAFAAGRFLLGAAADRIGARRLLRGGAVTAFAGCVLFAAAPGPLAAAGLVMAGLGLSPLYPTLMSGTLERLGHGRLARAVGIQVSAAMLGSIAVPGLTGLLAGWFGLGSVGALAVACAVAFAVLHEVLVRRPEA